MGVIGSTGKFPDKRVGLKLFEKYRKAIADMLLKIFKLLLTSAVEFNSKHILLNKLSFFDYIVKYKKYSTEVEL